MAIRFLINLLGNFCLEIRVSQFCVQESQAGHRPRHVDLDLLLAFQRIADVCPQSYIVTVGQIVADVPSAVAAVLDAHVAQHGVEVKDCHVERLRHLRRRQRVLCILVQHAQSLADNLVRCSKDSLARITQLS